MYQIRTWEDVLVLVHVLLGREVRSYFPYSMEFDIKASYLGLSLTLTENELGILNTYLKYELNAQAKLLQLSRFTRIKLRDFVKGVTSRINYGKIASELDSRSNDLANTLSDRTLIQPKVLHVLRTIKELNISPELK